MSRAPLLTSRWSISAFVAFYQMGISLQKQKFRLRARSFFRDLGISESRIAQHRVVGHSLKTAGGTAAILLIKLR
jgi:hypothetical protein